MDDVLCDFIGGLSRLWNVDIEGRKKAGEFAGTWNVVESLGRSLDNLDREFWAGLEPHSWMEDLLRMCDNLSREVSVITHPQPYRACFTGKMDWFFDHLDHRKHHIILTDHKERFAGPDVVLIDDSPMNCLRFYQRGGSSIVFPAVMNGLIFETNPMDELANRLEEVLHTLPRGATVAPSIQFPK